MIAGSRYFNIDKSIARPGEYVGYAGGAWRIRRNGKHWRAVRVDDGRTIQGMTLRDISVALKGFMS